MSSRLASRIWKLFAPEQTNVTRARPAATPPFGSRRGASDLVLGLARVTTARPHDVTPRYIFTTVTREEGLS